MAMLGLGREDWVIWGSLLWIRVDGRECGGQQKTPPLRCGVLRFGACCLRARSSRTCWRGNKDYEKRRRGGVAGVLRAGVALQHSRKLNRAFRPCQATRAKIPGDLPLRRKSLQLKPRKLPRM